MDLTKGDALARTLQLTRLDRLPDAADHDILAALSSVGMCVVADERNLASPSAQATVVTLAALTLASGISVKLAMPRVELLGHQPPLRGRELLTALVELGQDGVPETSIDVVREPAQGDLVFVLGDTEWSGSNDLAWRLSATAWSGQLLRPTEPAPRIQTSFPLGALGVAAAAAAEPYRAALREVVGRTGTQPPRASYLVAVQRARFEFAPKATPVPSMELGPIDLISGGAIANALLHALYRLPNVRAKLRLWEPEALDGTNLNRYALMRRSMIRIPKTDALQAWAPRGVEVETHRASVDAAVIHDIGTLAPHVVVGTDNLEARWLLQSEWPRWLGIGSTARFMVIVSEHEPGMPCARCLHGWTEDVPGPIPTISFVSYWAGLHVAARLLRHAATGQVSLEQQASQVWPDRLDRRLGYRSLPIQRIPGCPLSCAAGHG